MADSDDEYNDGRRRDKFVRERSDYLSNRGNTNSGGWQSNDYQPSYRSHQQQQRTDSYGRNQRYNQTSNYNASNYDHPPIKRGRINLNNWNENRYSNYEQNYDNSSYASSKYVLRIFFLSISILRTFLIYINKKIFFQ